MPNSDPLQHVDFDRGPELLVAPSSAVVPSRADVPAADAALGAGAMFGSYRICERIGQGAMGVVYRAEHALLEKQVALKVMAGPIQSNAEARQRFLKEAQTAAAIEHANVVDVTDVGVHEGTPFLVMELLAGEDLEHLLDERVRLSEHETVRLLVPIVAAVAAAHDRKIVHRDLKPSNIFLARDQAGAVTPKILDFGISRAPRVLASEDPRTTSVNELMGSPLYWPPEALNGARDLTEKSDQYSLGVVLYECVTGQSPVKGDSLFDLLTAIVNGDWPPPRRVQGDVSLELERVILRAMAREPESRFPDLRELGRALLELADVRTRMNWAHAFGQELSETEPGRATFAIQREPGSDEALTVLARRPAAWRRRSLYAFGLALAAGWVGHWALQLHTVPTAGPSATGLPPLTRAAPRATPKVVPVVSLVEAAPPAVLAVAPPVRPPESPPPSADERAMADPAPQPSEPPARRSKKGRAARLSAAAKAAREAAAASQAVNGLLHGANDAPIPE